MSVWSGKPVSRPTKVPDFWIEAPPPIQFDAAVTRWYPAQGEPASNPASRPRVPNCHRMVCVLGLAESRVTRAHPTPRLRVAARAAASRIGDSPVGRGGLHDSEDAMQIGPLKVLSRRSPRDVNLASWHSPHSLTWSWILSLSWERPGWVRPHFQWSSVGPHRFRGLSVGSIINIHAMRDNGGWQLGATLLGVGLHWHRQRPMWFRDLYWKRENERYERRAA